MLWYGSNKNPYVNKSFFKYLFNLNKKINLKTRSLAFSLNINNNNLNSKTIYVYIPIFWKILFLKQISLNNRIFFFYSDIYNFFLPINYKNLYTFYDFQTNVLVLNLYFYNSLTILFYKMFKFLFYSFNFFFLKK